MPYTQSRYFWPETLAVRTAADPLTLAKPVQAAIGRVDKDLALTRIQTLDEVVEQTMVQPRFRAALAAAFGMAALALAALGVYGVLAFAVTQRVKEFGIRLALGATASGLLRLVLGDGLRIVTIGLAAGLISGRVLDAIHFGVAVWRPNAGPADLRRGARASDCDRYDRVCDAGPACDGSGSDVGAARRMTATDCDIARRASRPGNWRSRYLDSSFNKTGRVVSHDRPFPQRSLPSTSDRKLCHSLCSSSLQRAVHNMAERWSSFARAGRPAAKGQTAETRATMEIDSECRVVDDPYSLERQVWKRLDP